MSDTTTITPEERRMFAEDANDILANEKKNLERRAAAKGILRLLTALEAAEARAEKAEAESARLRAERDWLAENIADRPCAYDSCPFGLPRPTGPDYGCGKTHVQCWQKALTPRRAVAAGEGE
ncbi:hypothetical protein [Desulfovibrio falkowii]|uniref:hypothetical protein n=1 Tax=Desulfovibrio sp. WGS1351 TaxID=3366814 RepID=UPI00372D7A93